MQSHPPRVPSHQFMFDDFSSTLNRIADDARQAQIRYGGGHQDLSVS
jgi:hypothetical protein